MKATFLTLGAVICMAVAIACQILHTRRQQVLQARIEAYNRAADDAIRAYNAALEVIERHNQSQNTNHIVLQTFYWTNSPTND